MNKKGLGTLVFLAGSVLIGVSFFMMFSFLIETSPEFAEEVEIAKCKAIISATSTSLADATSFLKNLRVDCPKESQIIRSTEEEEVYEQLAQRMQTCWRMYGEGKNDFLGFTKQDGSWCFTCAELSFELQGSSKPIYKFNEFVDWMRYNPKPGSSSELATTYYDSFPTSFSDGTDEDFREVEDIMEQARAEFAGTAEFVDFSLFLQNTYQNALELRIKDIDTSKNLYVVYRYDRWDKSVGEVLADSALDAGLATLGGAAQGLIIGLFVPQVGLVKTLDNVKDRAKGVQRVKKFYDFLGDFYPRLKKIVKYTAFGSAIGLASEESTELSVDFLFEKHSIQYVDVLSEEQYFRLCGIQPTVQ